MVDLLKNKRIDNRGSSFVEIIVSVLVVGIVFVPLLLGMNTAIIINRMSQSEQYADTVAQNCIESVKAVGKTGIEAKFASASPAADPGAPGVPASPAPGTSVTKVAFDSVYAGAELNKKSDTLYTITNIKQGTKTFNADIEFVDAYSAQNGAVGGSAGGAGTVDIINLSGNNSKALTDALAALKSQTINGNSMDKALMVGLLKEKQNILKIEKDSTSGDYLINAEIKYIFYNKPVSGSGEYFEDGSGTNGAEVEYVYSMPQQTMSTLPAAFSLTIDSVADYSDLSGINTNKTNVAVNLGITEGITRTATSLSGGDIAKETIVIQKSVDDEIEVQIKIVGVDESNLKSNNSMLYFSIQNTAVQPSNIQIHNPLGNITDATVSVVDNTLTIANAAVRKSESGANKMFKMVVTVKDVDSDYKLTRESSLIG